MNKYLTDLSTAESNAVTLTFENGVENPTVVKPKVIDLYNR